jgi:hypothetical protein
VRTFAVFDCAVCLIACGLLLTRCGGSPSAPAESAATLTLTSTGITPTEVRVPAFSKVLFINNDIRPHDMNSDPIPGHTDCPAINAVGALAPGERRSTGTLAVPRTCGFHDHDNELDAAWKGRIIVQ